MQQPDLTPAPDASAHAIALRLIDALYAIGIEVTSVREAVPLVGERGVRVGVLTVDDALTLCAILRAEEARRAEGGAEG